VWLFSGLVYLSRKRSPACVIGCGVSLFGPSVSGTRQPLASAQEAAVLHQRPAAFAELRSEPRATEPAVRNWLDLLHRNHSGPRAARSFGRRLAGGQPRLKRHSNGSTREAERRLRLIGKWIEASLLLASLGHSVVARRAANAHPPTHARAVFRSLNERLRVGAHGGAMDATCLLLLVLAAPSNTTTGSAAGTTAGREVNRDLGKAARLLNSTPTIPVVSGRSSQRTTPQQRAALPAARRNASGQRHARRDQTAAQLVRARLLASVLTPGAASNQGALARACHKRGLALERISPWGGRWAGRPGSHERRRLEREAAERQQVLRRPFGRANSSLRRIPLASEAFLARLSLELEILDVDYSNASNFNRTYGQRSRDRERADHLCALARNRSALPVADLLPHSERCLRQRYLVAEAALILGESGTGPPQAVQSAFACAPRRGMIVIFRDAPDVQGRRRVLNRQLLPLLERWGMSFDPISTSRLRRARFCCRYDRDKHAPGPVPHVRCCNMCCIDHGLTSGAELLFFVSDRALLSLSSRRLGTPPGASAAVGVLMASSQRFLGVAKTALEARAS